MNLTAGNMNRELLFITSPWTQDPDIFLSWTQKWLIRQVCIHAWATGLLFTSLLLSFSEPISLCSVHFKCQQSSVTPPSQQRLIKPHPVAQNKAKHDYTTIYNTLLVSHGHTAQDLPQSDITEGGNVTLWSFYVSQPKPKVLWMCGTSLSISLCLTSIKSFGGATKKKMLICHVGRLRLILHNS